MDRFSKLHPAVQLLFFAVSIIIPLSFSNPFLSALSLIGAVLYHLLTSGKKALKTMEFALVVMVFVSLFNLLFAHYGVDVLFTVKDIDFAIEALFYGFHQGIVVACSLIWFTALGRCIDSERIIYLFRFAPKCALIFSIVLGFIPRFLQKLNDISDAELGLNGGIRPHGAKAKLKSAINHFSALISYSLESSIITADSMSARGYHPKAVRAGRYHYTVFDIIMLIIIFVLSLEVIIQKAIGNLSFIFEPKIAIDRLSLPAVICFGLLELIPIFLDLWENLQWKLSTVKA